MTEKKEYIEREALVQRLAVSPLLSQMRVSCFLKEGVLDIIQKFPAADVVENEVLKEWLYEIAINNVGVVLDGDFSNACEEIIARLDGLRAFVRERKERG